MTGVRSARAGAVPSGETVRDAVVAHGPELQSRFAPLGADKLAVFGSVARREERDESDIDILVDLTPDTGLFAVLRRQRLAEELLDRRVDLVPRSELKPAVAATVLREAIPL